MGIWPKRWMRSLSIMNLPGGESQTPKRYKVGCSPYSLVASEGLDRFIIRKRMHLRTGNPRPVTSDISKLMKWGISYLCKCVFICGLLRLVYTYPYIHSTVYIHQKCPDFQFYLAPVHSPAIHSMWSSRIEDLDAAALSRQLVFSPCFSACVPHIFSPRNPKKTKVSKLHLQQLLALWIVGSNGWKKHKNLHLKITSQALTGLL